MDIDEQGFLFNQKIALPLQQLKLELMCGALNSSGFPSQKSWRRKAHVRGKQDGTKWRQLTPKAYNKCLMISHKAYLHLLLILKATNLEETYHIGAMNGDRGFLF